jgi:endonuclease III
MAKESNAAKVARTARIAARLQAAYPQAHCELNFTHPLELLVATILSARCTDKQVNVVTARLFRKYRRAADYASADPAELQTDLKAIGLFRNKAKNIQACCRQLVELHAGEVPRTMEALVQLDGVGRKTANVVLGNAFHLSSGIVVDTHVSRLAGRLHLSAQTDPEKIEADLMQRVEPAQWILFSHWLIWHGRRRCFARKPDCANCEIQQLCPSAMIPEAQPARCV